ncbi:hypothetical protein [Klebsiella pneumoniae]|uniref:hypothetical protein n=1 Tax=Klebsiella pneumoniae TaxID=573 RepID=UPI000DE60FEF|nr:hypothetical protein [Klebsiella pneumoniae]SSG63172.1 phage EaA protein [Klebsiella pneumoniae]HBT0596788.1 hypothetical protein [Klebsiella pneumoniae]HBX6129360.1 hypothetical protein [Klebsiella pneumoniae]
MTDITELAQREKFEAWFKSSFHPDKTGPYIKDQLYFAWKAAGAEMVEALEKAQQVDEELCNLLPPGVEYMDPPDGGDVTPLEGVRRMVADYRQRIAELESHTVKLPDGWQFEECEIEGCENGAIFSVGTGSRNIHLCDKCAHEPQNSRLKKSPLSKRLPFKMSAGIKVEDE